MTGDPTPAPQMPEDVANVIYALRPMNGCNEMDDAVALIEAQAAENVGLRAKLAEVTAERDQWRSDCLDANQSEHALRKRAEQAEAAGTFAQGIEAAARVGYITCAETRHVTLGDKVRDAIRALTLPVDVHPDDLAVDRFALAMKAKLAKKRAEGRGGWDRKDECSQQYLSILLRGHVCKGDPVDVANLAMMLHQRGEAITPTVDARETPIHCRQTGLMTADDTQAPQADPVREADRKTMLESIVARFQGDFNTMTEDEIDRECAEAESRVNEDTEWLEAVAARKELRALAGEQHD